nr:hypothetical protein [Cellulosimicrobium sp. MM]
MRVQAGQQGARARRPLRPDLLDDLAPARRQLDERGATVLRVGECGARDRPARRRRPSR